MTEQATGTILLVEDEAEIREMVAFSLTRAGFHVQQAESAEAALTQLDGVLPDLIILDWMLPKMSGVDLAKELRRNDHTRDLPIIMLTARGEEGDKLKGYEFGTDDYVTKPFSPKELIARIKALLRRTGKPTDGRLQVGKLVLDLAAHSLEVNGTVVSLGPTEFRLLEVFMSHPNRAFDREHLLDRVWGRGVYVEERTVDVHVLRLRKALKPHGADKCIETVRGVGYRFNA